MHSHALVRKELLIIAGRSCSLFTCDVYAQQTTNQAVLPRGTLRLCGAMSEPACDGLFVGRMLCVTLGVCPICLLWSSCTAAVTRSSTPYQNVVIAQFAAVGIFRRVAATEDRRELVVEPVAFLNSSQPRGLVPLIHLL